jgi:hypothetical protein
MENFGLVVLGVLVVPPILVAALRRTPVFWLPGVGLFVVALVIMGTTDWGHNGHEENPLAGAADAIAMLAVLALFVYGLICIVVGARTYARRPRPAIPAPPPAVELPTATLVNDPSKT